jgi:hypothetical protein
LHAAFGLDNGQVVQEKKTEQVIGRG